MTKTPKTLILILIGFSFFLNPNQICNHTIQAKSIKGFSTNPDLRIEESIEDLEDFTTEKPADVDLVLTWNMLKDITYTKRPHPDYGIIQQPVFGESLKKIDGKKVLIKGYIIPLDVNEFALSKTLYASCYFCGQEGPETVMGIQFKKLNKKLKTDMSVTLKGKFVLNPNDPDNWMYNLMQAEIVEID